MLPTSLLNEVRKLALVEDILLVYRLEGLVDRCRLAESVDRLLDQLLDELAGAGLAMDKHRRIQDVTPLGRQSDVELWIVARH